MNQCKTCLRETHPINQYCGWCNKRLEGVQGPERHLVGDVAERLTRQDDVEVRSREGAGVGEIGGAAELREYIARELDEARRRKARLERGGNEHAVSHINGVIYALAKLRKRVPDTDGQRSDLSNAQAKPCRAAD